MGKALAWVGGIGTMVGILCCFTPVLPIVLGALGGLYPAMRATRMQPVEALRYE